MGEAKRRKMAGESTKNKMVDLFAIFHHVDGQEETIYMSAEIPHKSPASKDQLLNEICTGPWKVRMDRVASCIVHYFSYTQSWKMNKIMPKEAFVINFHDYGNSHACRHVMGSSKENIKSIADRWETDHKQTHVIVRGAV